MSLPPSSQRFEPQHLAEPLEGQESRCLQLCSARRWLAQKRQGPSTAPQHGGQHWARPGPDRSCTPGLSILGL